MVKLIKILKHPVTSLLRLLTSLFIQAHSLHSDWLKITTTKGND